jgi:hypothetical protein
MLSQLDMVVQIPFHRRPVVFMFSEISDVVPYNATISSLFSLKIFASVPQTPLLCAALL